MNLAQDRGLYAGKLLADLGADVIKIEKPGGDDARQTGPFKDDVPGLERSLYFLSFNTNQKGITLNIDTREGQGIFKRLLERADVAVEDYQPGVMASLGLGYPVLRDINPRLVMVSVTGFGENGSYSGYKAPDIVSFAMGGLMFIAGDPAKPPVVAPGEQAFHGASLLGCFGVLAALYQRLTTGAGQWVQVSAQEAMASQEHLILRYDLESDIVRRRGSQHTTAPTRIYPCQDGFVYFFVSVPKHWTSLLEIMGNPETLMGEAWEDVRFRRLNVDVIDPIITDFTMKHTKMELTLKCQAKHIPCTPVNTPGEFVNDPHIRARGFIDQLEHPVLGKQRHLGTPFRVSGSPGHLQRAAPNLGQQNEEIYCGELGYSREDLGRFKTEGVI